MRFSLMAICVAVASTAMIGQAQAERWVQLSPWNFLDVDSIRREGPITYYVVVHSSVENVDPRTAGWLNQRVPETTRVDCNEGILSNIEGGQWVPNDYLDDNDPVVPYVCPDW